MNQRSRCLSLETDPGLSPGFDLVAVIAGLQYVASVGRAIE
ncbi:MAG: hypothetical protein ACJA1E_000008 [Paracoccaceae bacterium]|jgi:hypothetical protein